MLDTSTVIKSFFTILCGRMKPNVNYQLWMIMVGQCESINFNKCITLVVGDDNEGGYAQV